ncbi:Tad domain-containing protein [Desulforamulus putei]|uniref:TadE/TadG family type IV pilus assembly protein n=1 Tax=Desulforamulus putei TaxID=74701 RepID=UPI002FDDF767
MKSIFKDNRGVAFIYTLMCFMVFLLFISVAVDVGHVLMAKIKAKHSLNLALRAAANEIDMDRLADPVNPVLYIKEPEARANFDRLLQKNLKLDAGFNPDTGSIAEDRVTVEAFQVFNTVPNQFTYGSYTENINDVCVSAVIKVPIKLSGFAKVSADIPEDFDLYVQATVKPQLIPQT